MTSAGELAAAFRDGRATPREVAERALAAAAALDRLEPPMRLLIALDAADVRAQADLATARHRAGRARSPLDGVPIAIKDEYAVRGYPSTYGTSFLGGAPAEADMLVVARLREAGAVLFGKTNMHELGMAPSGLNPHHGTARNPHDPLRDTGGSSSGSGAIVAAGVVPLALGTDSGGSVRIPSALCGVAGLKPTYGRVPTDGAAILYWSLEHFGPLGATVDDVAQAFALMAGEPYAPAPVEKPRLGVCVEWWSAAEPEVARVARAAVDRLLQAGAVEVPIELPHIEHALAVGAATFTVEAAAALETHIHAGRPFSPSVQTGFAVARAIPAIAFVRSQRVRALIARDFDRALERCDAVVSPTTAITAPLYPKDAFQSGELDEAKINALVCFTFPGNLTGLPAMQVPCGVDAAGLPVGLQLMGAHGADWRLLGLAAAVEKTAERRRPRVAFELLG
jgi:Asp-tRNA(Asn)/Glu-tRNA(Gln) amidotransferase A subunit family amidase